jgi:RNA polymerase sigma-70 factor (sigma-E family)
MARPTPDFDRFVAQHGDGLVRTAYLIVFDLVEAEDLVQETLFKVARRWPKVRRMDHPLAYARRILVNLALDGSAGRSRRRAELSNSVSGRDPVAPVAPTFDAHDDLYRALAELPPRQRAVLVLRYFNDLTEAQTADVLGFSPGTVKSNASRGLARLREALAPTPNPTEL